jgi:hypothetical protein
MKTEDEKLLEHIKKVEVENLEQDSKIQQSDSNIDQLKNNHHSHSEILEAILKELKEKDQTIANMNTDLNSLLKERDGGNDVIKDEFDAKIKKVYDEVAVKANADRLEEVFKTNSEEIASVKTSFEERVIEIDKKQVNMDQLLEETGAKIVALDTTAKETKIENKSTTDTLETKQDTFKVEMGQMTELHNLSDKERIEETNKINTKVKLLHNITHLMVFRSATCWRSRPSSAPTSPSWTARSALMEYIQHCVLVSQVVTQLESIDKKTEDTQNNLKELQQVCCNMLKEFTQVR